jgi:MYXO-CTERM domain-containing protein
MLIGASLTVRNWAYEDEPDTAIHVEPIPAPPAGVAALTLLGLGAAGVRSWRKRNATD